MGTDANTAVVTDTTAYLPDELVAEHGIHTISLYVTLDGEQRRESEIRAEAYDDFFERLRDSADGATTSQPSVGDFTDLYEPLLADGRRGGLDPHLVRDLGHLRLGAAGPPGADRQGRRRRSGSTCSTAAAAAAARG